VRCWGINSSGELGIGTFSSNNIGDTVSDTITNVRLGGPARKIATGDSHTCALMQNGFMRCWGFDGNHQIGNTGSPLSINDPGALGDIPTSDEVAEIGLGRQHTCALLVDGQATCWGLGSEGQLGRGDTLSHSQPPSSINLGGSSAYLIAGGTGHTCAVKSNGRARCWGRGDEGQLGQGATADALAPTVFPNDIAIFAAP
ncbi:MAG TPA: alpha-L-fucosidase, partial [Haliangium sp.]|nr:alpha-L-fucosidase [Haliangium sp.]